ncbi:hypothetical protein SAMN02910298_00214 [Pseudobutyrivibrio sp. YE44]|nr:hypothetical protein SAMN02910298_00214 [Pseudobutyrivibrio sp. YE44]
MKEKMFSKTEMKRIMVQQKRVFIRDVFKEFMIAYTEALSCARDSMTMTVTVKNDNHYITFEEFGKHFKLCIFTNGNVVLRMKEHNEDEYEYYFFEFVSDVKKQHEFVEHLRHGLARKVMNVALQTDFSYKLFMECTWCEYEFEKAYEDALLDLSWNGKLVHGS